MYSRPTPQESEEDVLRLQEEFQQNKIKSAATVISEKKEEESVPDADISSVEMQDQIANTFEAIPESKHLGNIVEKNPGEFKAASVNHSNSHGFPTAKRRDVSVDSAKSGRSIFSQQFKKLRPNKDPPKLKQEQVLPTQSFIVAGSERDSIHEENISKLETMSEEEILEEREKLLATMDPAIVAFLKSRRPQEMHTNRNPTIQQQNEAAQSMHIEEIETPSAILKHPESERWINFSAVETGKLAWMKDVERAKIEKDCSFEARFDFDGWLLPYTETEVTEKSRVLYHHGEEPSRPGYTLQELFQLSRSNITQQKIVALNCIANILALQSTGVYDDVIELPIEQIFFVVRFCLDENTPSVLLASIKAMRNLFYSKMDEICIDCLLGFGLGDIQPILAVDNDHEDDNTVNDQQLAESNLVKCLARTDILVRIRYIMDTVKPSVETVVYCMDVLTRLVRDSQYILTKVYKCENLISTVLSNFVPNVINPHNVESPYGLPLLQAIRFLRVLAARSQTIATDLVQKYKLMDSMMSYLSSEHYLANANGLKLQTESLRLWSVLIHYGLALDYLQVLQPILLEMLNYHFKNTDLDMTTTTFIRQGHASALLAFIGTCKLPNIVTPFIPILHNCVLKWCTQLMSLTEFAYGKLQIIASVFNCLARLTVTETIIVSDDTCRLIVKVINSNGFKTITETITNGSMLLNNYETHRSSPNLKSVEAAVWYAAEHVVPLLQTNSPVPFLSALSDFVNACSDRNMKLAFLRHENVMRYLQKLVELDKYHMTSNWFTRVEANMLMNILKCSVYVRSDLDTRRFYEVAVKCLNIFGADQKPNIEYVLRNIIFSASFYPSDVLIGNLTIDQRSGSLETSLENLNEIVEVYVKVLGLKIDIPTFTTNLCLDQDQANVIPLDWIYTPIIVLYSKQQQNKEAPTENEQVFVIRNCLRWVLIYETYFPVLASAMSASDRFCRIACVFLASDNLFLIDEIHNLLQLCLNNIMKNEDDLNFNKEIQGLSSFQDFYTQLLEQYQGVSYGDVLFGNFILVPLAQRHAVKWRKTLWSEYMGVVEIFNVTPEQCVCRLETLLNPNEEDLSLLKCYRRALVGNSVRKHSILYLLAKHHVETFIANKKNKQ